MGRFKTREDIEDAKELMTLKDLLLGYFTMPPQEWMLERDKTPVEVQTYIRHTRTVVHIAVTHDRETKETKTCVEYPSHKDGVFHTIEVDNMQQAAKIFEWAAAVLLDIREVLDDVV